MSKKAFEKRNFVEINSGEYEVLDIKNKDLAKVRLPYDLSLERELIGALIYDNNNINSVVDTLKYYYFYEKLHGAIYSIILSLIDKGKVADIHSIENHLLHGKEFEHLFEYSSASEIAENLKQNGGADYLAKLAATYIIGFTNTRQIAEDIRDYYLRRSIVAITQQTYKDAYSDFSLNTTPVKIIEEVEDALFKLAGESVTSHSTAFKSFAMSLKDVILQIQKAKQKGGLSGIDTGFNDINRYIHGWQPSDLIIIAGRPSMGKTSFAISIALNAALEMQKERLKLENDLISQAVSQGRLKSDVEQEVKKEAILRAGCVGVFSLEMSADQLTTRILAIETGLDTSWLVGGTIDDLQFSKVVDASQKLDSLPLYIDETPSISIAQIRTRAKRLKRRFGLKILIIDYLQLIRGNNSENRVQEISAITQGLKSIAKELNIPVIALSQLSRNVEAREDKRPQLSDLRESGSIEQDADIVMFLYRDSYYLERTRPEGDEELLRLWEEKNGDKLKKVKNKSEIIIAKHRNGPIGTAILRFDEETTRFDNLAKEDMQAYTHE